MQEYLTQAWGWIRLAAVWVYEHPQFWPIVLALITWLCKPQTPAEYAKIASRNPQWFWTRWVEVMRLVGALGLDPIKVVKVLQKLAKTKGGGKSDPPPPPSGPSVLLGVLALCGALLCLTQMSCKDTDYPRATVRSIVALTAEGAKQADIACETVAIHTQKTNRDKGIEIALKCGNLYDQARYSLINAEQMLDAWDDAAAGRTPCAVKHAIASIADMAALIYSGGEKIPPAVDDAAKVAELYTGLCRE